jgi:MYXO-CTERM domain-containing protein
VKSALLISIALLAIPSVAGASLTPEGHERAIVLAGLRTYQSTIVESADVVWVGEPPPGIAASDVEEAIRKSVASWNAVSCSTAHLGYGGHADALEDVEEGAVPLLFSAPNPDLCFPEGFLGFTVLACSDVPSPTVFLNIQDYDWSVTPAPYQDGTRLTVDLTAVITHELGHVLGLGHDEDDSLATMHANYLLDGGQASLAANDKRALCTITGGGGAECKSDDDCDDFGTCEPEVDELPRVCQEERGDFGDYCSASLMLCEVCLITDITARGGYCTGPCEDDSDCPEFFFCSETEDGDRCELNFPPSDPGGCSVYAGKGGGSAPTALLLALLALFRRRRP